MRGCAQVFALLLTLFGALCVFMAAVMWLPFISDDMQLDLVGVAFFVILGTLCYLAGSWLQKKVPPVKPKTFVLKPGDKKFITAMLLRDRRLSLILGLFFLAFTAVMLLVFLQPENMAFLPEYRWIEYILSGGVLLLCGFMGVGSVYLSFTLRNPSTTRLYHVLMKTPEKVSALTVHLYQHEGAPGTVGRQIVAMIQVEGEELRTGATEEQWSLLKQYVQLHNPHATYREVEHGVSGGY
jgi:hypothetical protein